MKSFTTYKLSGEARILFLVIATTIHSLANPTGGQVTAGSASIDNSPGTVTINQNSKTAIINWQSFSIANGELTKFVQPSAGSAVLNRVLGGGTSVINGTLSANGQVYLINGNGIIVGSGGVVDAAGFTASTRDITDSDFLAGKLHFTGAGDGGVQNLGSIHALGGDVYLIGKTVDNEGSINAPLGTVGLAAADDVLLAQANADGSMVTVNASSAANSAPGQTGVHNSGTITAAAAELKAANGNIYALAINNEGTVRASTVKKQGGHIFLTGDTGVLVNSGTLDASATADKGHGGSVIMKDMGGTTYHSGAIIAKGGENGTGGNAEVSGETEQFTGTVDLSADGGANGQLLLDPRTITVATSGANTSLTAATTQTLAYTDSPTTSIIAPSVLNAALVNATVTLQAIDDIEFTQNVTGGTNGNLVLSAGRSITVDSGITLALNGSLTAVANDSFASGVTAGTPVIALTGATIDTSAANGNINLSNAGGAIALGTLKAGTGTVRLTAAGDVTESGGSISAGTLGVRTTSGNITLNNPGNAVTTFAASNSTTDGSVSYVNGSAFSLNIGNIAALTSGDFNFSSISGVTTTAGINQNNSISLSNTGTLQLSQGVSAPGSNVLLSSGSDIIETGGTVTTSGLAFVSATNPTLISGNTFLTLAAQITDAGEAFSYTSGSALTIGPVLGVNGIHTNNGAVTLGVTSGDLTLTQAVNAGTAGVHLSSSAGSVTESGVNAGVVGSTLRVDSVNSAHLAQANTVSTLAANVTGAGQSLTFYNSSALTLGAASSLNGITTSNGDINVSATGTLTLTQGVNAGTANVRLVSSGNMTQSGSGLITAGTLGAQNVSTTAGNITLALNNQFSTLNAANSFSGGTLTVVDANLSGLSIRNVSSLVTGNFSFINIDGVATSAGNIGLQSAGAITLGQVVNAGTGIVRLDANGSVTQTGSGIITAGTLGVRNDSTSTGDITLTLNNQAGILAAANAFSGGTITIVDASSSGFAVGSANAFSTGNYSFTVTSGVTTTGGGNINLQSAQTMDIFAAINAGGGTVRLVGNSTISQNSSGDILAGALGVRNNGSTGDIILTGGNSLDTFAGSNSAADGSLTFSEAHASGLTIGSVAAFSSGNFNFSTTNGAATTSGTSHTNSIVLANNPNVTVAQSISAPGAAVTLLSRKDLSLLPGTIISGDSLTLSADGKFLNGAGSSALDPGAGNYLVYSNDRADNTEGGLTPDFIQYNATYGSTTVLGTGNGFLYTQAPVITASLTGQVNKTYDGTTHATLTSSNYQFGGDVNGDTVTINDPTSGTYIDENAGTNKQVTVAGVAISSATNNGAIVYGYQLDSGTISANIGNIGAASIALTLQVVPKGNSVYGQDLQGQLAGLAVTGLIGDDTVASLGYTSVTNTGASITTTTDPGTYKLTLGGSLTNPNYVLASGTINPDGMISKWTVSKDVIAVNAAAGTSIYGQTPITPTAPYTITSSNGITDPNALVALINGTPVTTGLNFNITNTTNVGSYKLNQITSKVTLATGLKSKDYTLKLTKQGIWTVTPDIITIAGLTTGSSIQGSSTGFDGSTYFTVTDEDSSPNVLTFVKDTGATLNATAKSKAGIYAVNVSGTLNSSHGLVNGVSSSDYKILLVKGIWTILP